VLNEFAMPITWATVGHLFLDSCNRDGQYGHGAMPRPPANPLWQGDWYKHDPCTDLRRDPLWYAPDLIQQVLSAKASHSFSHIDFSAETSDDELVRREMEQSLAAMEPFGIRLRSLVYPFNHMGHSYHELLHRFGIIAVRHRDEKIRLSYPERTAAGVYKIYESMNLRSSNLYHYRDKAELFLDHAMKTGAAYHLWFHPSDPRAVFQREFCEVLRVVQRQREAGNVWAATMADLAAYCEARECTSLEANTENGKTALQIKSTLDTSKYGTPEITLKIPGKTMPKRITRHIAADSAELTPAEVCAGKNGWLILNVPAVTQTITLWF
jgi:hypothetical protein